MDYLLTHRGRVRLSAESHLNDHSTDGVPYIKCEPGGHTKRNTGMRCIAMTAVDWLGKHSIELVGLA